MNQAYYSEFYPALVGRKGSTIPVVTTTVIEAIQTDLDTLGDSVTDISSDSVLSKGEKSAVIIEYSRISAEFDALKVKANALTGFTSQVNAAQTSFNTLTSYLTGLTPAWNNTTLDTTIVAAIYQANWIDLYEEVANLNAAIHGLPGAGSLAYRNSILLGDTYIRTSGNVSLTDALAVTSLGTAAAITGQGAFATVNTAAYGSGLLTGFGGLAPLNQVNLGASGQVYRDGGTVRLTDALAVTSLGTAAAITGQGAFATVNTAAYGSGLLTGFGALAPLSRVRLGAAGGYIFREDDITVLTDTLAVTSLGTAAAITGQGALATIGQVNLGASGRVYRDDGTTRLTDTLAVTSLGTAAAITGQGAFATVNTAAYGGGLLTGFGTLSPLNQVRIGSSGGHVFREDNITALTDNITVTSLGTAAAITGQGAFATVNTASYGSGLLTGFGALAPLSQVNLGASGRVYRDDGTTRLTDTLAVTSLGTAAAITGQGALATLGSVDLTTGQVTNKSLVNLDATAASLLNYTSGVFVSFVGAGNVTATYGGGTKSGSTANNTSFYSAPMTDGVVFQGRAVNNSGKLQSIILTTNPSSVVAYAAGDYGFYLDGTNLRTVKNGSVFVIGLVQTTEQLTLSYDNKTGVINYYRGNILIDTATVSTGTTYNVAWRPITNGCELANGTIWSYTNEAIKLATVEAGANPSIGEGSIIRNSSFELSDSTGLTSGWKNTSGNAGIMTRVIDTDAKKGQYMLNVTGGIFYLESEIVPVKPGQQLWFHPRVKLLLGSDGTSTGTLRLQASVVYSEDPAFLTSGSINHSQMNDTQKTAGTTYEAIDKITIPATYSSTKIPKYAKIYVRFITAAPTLNQTRIDFLDLRDTQAGATLGAQSGTNIYRTDGTTVLTQAEIRTTEGTASAITGQGAFATVNTAAYGSGLLTGFGVLASLTKVNLGASGRVYRDNGSTRLTDALAVTSLGTAASITSQGALATLGQVNLGVSGRVYRDDGTTRLTDTLAVTSLGTASAIAGQGTGATANNLSQLNSTEGSKFSGIETGADVTSYITGSATIPIYCDYLGTPKDGELTKEFIYRLYKAGIVVNSGVTWAATTLTGTLTKSINSTGTLSITTISTSTAKIRIDATLSGLTRQAEVNIEKILDAPPTGGPSGGNPGTTATTGTITSSSATTYGSANAGPLTVVAGTAGQIVCTANALEFNLSGGAAITNVTAYGKWQWRVIGGSWADIDTEDTSSTNASRTYDNDAFAWVNDPGSLTAIATKTGLTSGTSYEVQLLLRTNATRNMAYTGYATGVGS